MKYGNLRQLTIPLFDECRQAQTREMVSENFGVFYAIAEIIQQSKKEFEERIWSDPKNQIYNNKTYFSFTLTQIIKANIDIAIESGSLKLLNADFCQCQFYRIPDVGLSIYVKKLDEKGLPSFGKSNASEERLKNREDEPCVFIGPRISQEGIVGGVCLSITNGKDDTYWVHDIVMKDNKEEKTAEFIFDVNDDIKPKENYIKVKKNKIN